MTATEGDVEGLRETSIRLEVGTPVRLRVPIGIAETPVRLGVPVGIAETGLVLDGESVFELLVDLLISLFKDFGLLADLLSLLLLPFEDLILLLLEDSERLLLKVSILLLLENLELLLLED
jgi:hypothetical protein